MSRFVKARVRPQLQVALVVCLIAGLVSAAARPRVAHAAPRPNVLIIVTDDQRADTLGQMGNIRRLFAQQGTKYSDAYSTTPLCCPARASIFTGSYAHNHGVISNGSGFKLDHDKTLQAYLQDSGYRTALVGKFLNQWELERRPPHFDNWAVFKDDPPSTDGYVNEQFNIDGKVRRVRRYSTDFIAAHSRDLLGRYERRDSKPWFMMVAPFAPHSPSTPARRHRDAAVPSWQPGASFFEKDLSDKPPHVAYGSLLHSPSKAKKTRRQQLRSLMSVDDLVGGVFKRLKSLNEAENTVAFFLSDNGMLWGEHGLVEKRLPYTEAVKIPMLVRWPGHIAEGAVDDRLVANIDIAPTVMAATGASSSHPMDGRSLLDSYSRTHLLMEYWRFDQAMWVPTWSSLRTKTDQLIEYVDDSGRRVAREYYDTTVDPGQLDNSIDKAEYRIPVLGLQEALNVYRTCVGITCP